MHRLVPAAQKPPPRHLAAGGAQHPRRGRGRHRRELERLRGGGELGGRQGQGDRGLEVARAGVAEELHEARAGVGAGVGDGDGAQVRVRVRHGVGDDRAEHGVLGVLPHEVVGEGGVVEGGDGRGVGVRAGGRRRAGVHGRGGGVGRRRMEEHGHLEGRVGVAGVRIRVSGWRRHGRRQWSE